jgi:hypothetical protein
VLVVVLGVRVVALERDHGFRVGLERYEYLVLVETIDIAVVENARTPAGALARRSARETYLVDRMPRDVAASAV